MNTRTIKDIAFRQAHRIIGTIYEKQAEYGKNDNPNLVPAGDEFGLSFYFYCETAKRTMAQRPSSFLL